MHFTIFYFYLLSTIKNKWYKRKSSRIMMVKYRPSSFWSSGKVILMGLLNLKVTINNFFRKQILGIAVSFMPLT